MGCAMSRPDKKEDLQICKERRRLMKQLVVFRGEFAEAQLAYLRTLRNTGAALRQFSESDSFVVEDASYGIPSPPSPPPRLPPAPPPPPSYTDERNANDKGKAIMEDESIDLERGYSNTSPPTDPSSSWFYSFFEPLPSHEYPSSEMMESVEDEWEDARTEFEEDDQDDGAVYIVAKNSTPKKPQSAELSDDNSTTTSWYAKECSKESASMAVGEFRRKRTLDSIMRDLDEHFVKASNGGKEIAVLMDVSKEDGPHSDRFTENKRKRYNSSKVFNAFSWSWPSKSPHLARDGVKGHDSNDPCRRGAHCMTLKKLYTAERSLFKEMKEEETTRLECERKVALLQKLEAEDIDWIKTDKTRLIVESLEANLSRLRDSISRICSTIQELIETELYPQLVALTSGLGKMWIKMHECHQSQNRISQQLNDVTECQDLDLASDNHRQTTLQLENEVALWYKTFCKLMKSQQAYVRTLCRWIQRTTKLVGDSGHGACSSAARRLCKEWQLALDGLPVKETSEAIMNLFSAIHSILLQQMEEYNLQKKLAKLERKLKKEQSSLAEMEKKIKGCIDAEDNNFSLSHKNPLLVKGAKIVALKKHVDDEKAKYQNAVKFSRDTTLNNLKRTLPKVFQALMEFSGACAFALESITNPIKPTDSHDDVSQASTSSVCSDQDKT